MVAVVGFAQLFGPPGGEVRRTDLPRELWWTPAIRSCRGSLAAVDAAGPSLKPCERLRFAVLGRRPTIHIYSGRATFRCWKQILPAGAAVTEMPLGGKPAASDFPSPQPA